MAEVIGDEEGGVWFYGPYDRQQDVQLKIRNGTHRKVAFRLKCTRPMHFQIRPSHVAVLKPNESQLFTFTAEPGANELENCGLMLELVTIRDQTAANAEVLDLVEFWNNMNLARVKRTAIPIFFGQDAVGDDDDEIVVILITETMLFSNSENTKRVFQDLKRRYPNAMWLFVISLLLLAVIAFLVGWVVGLNLKHRSRQERLIKQ